MSLQVSVPCYFIELHGQYTCQIAGETIPDNESLEINFTGRHIPGHDDSNVEVVQIFDSSIALIIPQIFTTFTNALHLQMLRGGLTRFQADAFANAGEIQEMTIVSNPELKEIPANAFVGCNQLQLLTIWQNEIETVAKEAFNGLPSLLSLSLERNRITFLPVNVFKPLKVLERIFLHHNQIESINGQMFAGIPRLRQISISNNQVNAIEKNFLDNVPSLRNFDIQFNVCASGLWTIGSGVVTVETVRSELETCFSNFEKNYNLKLLSF